MTKKLIFISWMGLAAAGCDIGTEGELGRGDFVYTCAYGTDDPSCSSSSDEQSIPWSIAVGADFSLRYDADDAWSRSVHPASRRHASTGAAGFAISVAGPTGFLALGYNNDVYDLIHIWAYPVSRLELLCDGFLGGRADCGTSFPLPAGESAMVQAMPYGENGDLLAGALDYDWQIADTSIASLGMNGGRFVEILAISPGTTELTVTAGGASAQFEIVVDGEVDTETGSETETDTEAGADAGVDASTEGGR